MPRSRYTFGRPALIFAGFAAIAAPQSNASVATAPVVPSGASPHFAPPRSPLVPERAFADAYTDRAIGKLQARAAECGSLSTEYRVDCLSNALLETSRALNRADYRDARIALKQASDALRGLVDGSVDKTAPTLRQGERRYRAVQKSKVKTVQKQARAILQETETRLLRSGGSALRKTHFQRIARAVGSTKPLLRS